MTTTSIEDVHSAFVRDIRGPSKTIARMFSCALQLARLPLWAGREGGIITGPLSFAGDVRDIRGEGGIITGLMSFAGDLGEVS